MKKLKLIPLFIAALMLSSCATLMPESLPEGYIQNEYFTYKIPEPVDISILEYESVDMEELKNYYDELSDLGETATDFSEIAIKLDEIGTKISDLLTQQAIAYVQYSLDATNQELIDNNLEATENGIEASTMAEESFIDILSGKYKDDLTQLIGEDYANELIENGAKTPEHVALLEQELQLVQQYEEASIQEYSYEHDGKTWTIEMFYTDAGELEFQTQYEIYYGIVLKKNEVLATIFSDLVEVRKEIAVLEGYENYADYAYEVFYARDYSPSEAILLQQKVKEYISPISDTLNYDLMYSYTDGVSKEDMIEALQENILDVSPLFEEPFNFLIDNNALLYTDDLENSLPGAFTADYYSYDVPGLYMQATDSTYDIQTLVHEFGHFTESYYNTIDSDNEPLLNYDIAEVHAMGLEMLMHNSSYDEIFNDNSILYGNVARRTSVIIDACLFDEFLQEVYSSDHKLTVDELNSMFIYTEAEYRDPSSGVGYEYTWVDVPHNFTDPFYYISYGVAALHAFDIFRIAEESGLETATDKYFDLMAESMKDLPYSQIMENVELGTFMNGDYVENISIIIDKELQSLLAS